MMRKKIKIPKLIKLYLIKQLNKLSGLNLNLNSLTYPKRLTSSCNYPRTPSMDKRIPDVQYVTDHESTLDDFDRYMWLYFPSSHDYNHDTECSSIDTSTQPSEANCTDLSTPTSKSSVAPSSMSDNIKEREEGVPVVTFSTDPYNEFKRSMKTMLEAYQRSDNEFLSELVHHYLAENEKCLHKHILDAYTDVLMEIRQSRFRYEREADVEVEEDKSSILVSPGRTS